MHRYDLENESWKLEWIILRWRAPENQTEKTPELLRMGEKNSRKSKTIMRGWHQARTMNLQENGQDLRETLLQSSKSENDNEKPPWIVEILQDENWKGWTNDEKNLKDLGERHMTDDNPFLRQTLKRILEGPGKLEESGKILGKDLWVRAHPKDTPLNNWLKGGIAPVELNDLNEITTSKKLEWIENGNTNLPRYLQYTKTNE